MTPEPHLIAFDLDGTLVEDHLVDRPCDRCEGLGTENLGGKNNPRIVECRRCHGKLTILVPRRDTPYTEPILMEGVRERLDALRVVNPRRFAICTNQGGVALGFQTIAEVRRRIARSLELVDFFDGAPVTIHCCIDHPASTLKGFENPSRGKLHRRKPNPGMLIEAMVAAPAMAAETVFIGDRQTDRETAERAEVRFVDAADWLANGLR